MGQLDNPAQIAFLFVGATFVSFVLIALLNAEARNRLQNPEPKIQSSNIFSTLLHRVSRLVSDVVDSNTTHKDYRYSMQQRFRGRSLKWIPIIENDILSYQTKMTQIKLRNESRHKANANVTILHHIRHHGKHHKEAVIQQQGDTDIWKAQTSTGGALNGTTTKWRPHDDIAGLNVSSAATLDVEKTPICYTTNEVLIIIGLTCVLNFAFIVLIMSCVHFCSSATTRKIADLPRLESLVVIESGETSDTYCDDVDIKEDILRQSTSVANDSRQTVEDYIKSLPVQLYLSADRSRSESMLSLHSLDPARRRHSYQQLVSSLDDLVSETTIRDQQQHNGVKYGLVVNANQTLSASAENLLFV